MKLTLCLIAAGYVALDLCLWHGPLDKLVQSAIQPAPAVIAAVRGQPITADDLDHATREELFREGLDWAVLNETTQAEARKQVLGKLMDGTLVRAARLADTPHPRDAQGVDEELRLFIKQFPLDTDYPERLPLQHLTEAQLRDRMKAAREDQAWIDSQIAPQLDGVTEADARTWYAAHAAELTIPESFHAAHVFLAGHEKNEKDNPDHTTDIAALHQKLVTGQVAFEALARTASEDDRTKANGGDLGWFTRHRMPADFMAAVTALSPGQLSRPVHTWLGWHVIKLIEKKPARVPAFEEVRDEVLEMLRNEKREVAVRALLDRLRKA